MAKVKIKYEGLDFPLIFDTDLPEVFSYLLTSTHSKHSRLEIKKENCIKMLGFFMDTLKVLELKRSKGAGSLVLLSKLIKHVESIKTDAQFDIFYYDLVLGYEGKPNLRGFGFAK